MLTVKDLLEKAEGLAESNRDYTVPMEVLSFVEDGDDVDKLFVPGEMLTGEVYGVNRHAFFQMTDRLGARAGAGFLRDEMGRYPGAIAYNMNRLLGDEARTTLQRPAGPKMGFVRTRGGDTVRAFLSDQYQAYDIHQVLRLVDKAIGDVPHKILRPYQDGDEISARIVLDRDMNDGTKRGVLFRSSDIGTGPIGFFPFVEILVCTNGLTRTYFDKDEELAFQPKIAHRWITEAQMEMTVAAAIVGALKLSTQIVDDLAIAARRALPSIEDVMAGMVKATVEKELQDQVLYAAGRGTTDGTVAGLVQGLTYAAHAVEDLNPNTVDVLESLGGTLLRRNAQLGENASDDVLIRSFFQVADPRKSLVEAFLMGREAD